MNREEQIERDVDSALAEIAASSFRVKLNAEKQIRHFIRSMGQTRRYRNKDKDNVSHG